MTIEKFAYLLKDVKEEVLSNDALAEDLESRAYYDGQLDIIKWVEETLASD